MLRMAVPVAALLIGVALLLTGTGLLNTILPLRGQLEGYSTRFLGLVMSGYFMGFLVGTFLGPKLIRRIGQIRAFACCAAVVTCCSILHALWVDPWIWLLLRILTGTALVTLYTAIESWLNGQATQANRGQMLALYMIVNLMALACAQQFIQLASPMMFTLFALAAMFICSALIPVTLTRMEPPPIPSAPQLSFASIVKVAPTAVVGAVLSGLTMGAFWTLSPVFANRLFNDLGAVAGFMSSAIVGGALMQIPLGRYSDRHDRRLVLAVTAGFAALSAMLVYACVNWLGAVRELFYVTGFLYGGFAFAIYPIAVAHLIDHLEKDQVLDGSSGFLLLHGIGAVVGPIVGGLMMDEMGAGILPLYFVFMQLSLCVLVALSLRKVPVSKEETVQTAHYVPMVRTTPTVLELHPDQPPSGS